MNGLWLLITLKAVDKSEKYTKVIWECCWYYRFNICAFCCNAIINRSFTISQWLRLQQREHSCICEIKTSGNRRKSNRAKYYEISLPEHIYSRAFVLSLVL